MLVSMNKLISRTAIAVALCASAWAQEAAKPGEPQWKDRAEYDLVQSIGTEQDPTKKLALVKQWEEKYPGTEFKKLRASYNLQAQQALNRPADIYKAAKDVLAIDPQDMFAMSMISYLTPVLTDTSPEALDLGEKAAQGVLASLDATFEAAKKPESMPADQWAQQRSLAEAQSHKTLGWIAMIRKNAPQAQDHFTKSLEKNAGQGDVSYWLGQTVMGQKQAELYPLGIWHVARAVAYDGPGSLPAAGRTQVNDYLTKAYKGYHGDETGLPEVKAQAKASALPPAGFTIKSVKAIAEEKLKQDEQFATENPKLAFWKRIKEALMAPDGQQYFDSSMKDAQIPELRGWLVEQRPKEILIAISDKTTPELTLQSETPFPGKVEPGTELTFEGVGKSFTKEPFMVVMEVDRKNVKGWPSAPAAKKPARAKAKRR